MQRQLLSGLMLVVVLVISSGTALAREPSSQQVADFADAFGFWPALTPDATNLDYGIPLTAEEVAEIHRRDGLVVELQRFMRAHGSDPNLGGVWIDHKAGGVPVVAIKGQDAALATAALALPGAKTQTVDYSYQELLATYDGVIKAFLGDPAFIKAEVDVAGNVVKLDHSYGI
jgi:hypothetical protein